MNINRAYSKAMHELVEAHKANLYACFDLVTKESFNVLVSLKKLGSELTENNRIVHTYMGRIVSIKSEK